MTIFSETGTLGHFLHSLARSMDLAVARRLRLLARELRWSCGNITEKMKTIVAGIDHLDDVNE
jgi:hypothetical protein